MEEQPLEKSQPGAGDAAEKSFPTLADVLVYLEAKGWKVTKTSLYRHHGGGKLLPGSGGTYDRKDIDKYAKTWLKQTSTGKKVQEKIDDLQRRKLTVELDNLDLENKRKRRLDEKETGKLVPREQMEIELAGRAGILEAGLKHWIQSRAAEWIRITAGDMKKVGELINLMSRDLDEHINSYAISLSYQIVIDAEEDATGETPEIEEEPTKEE